MFQRTLLRQAQAARSILSTSSPSTASLALRRTTQQPRIPAIRPFVPRSTRLYSTETKEATEAAKEKAEKSESAENAEAEDPIKKELEQKTKEAIEFKVSYFPILTATGSSATLSRMNINQNFLLGQMAPLRRGIPQPC